MAIATLLLIAIIPAYVAGTIFVGTFVVLAAFICWWLLRISVRELADLPNRFLDERQLVVRDRAYFNAFRIYASTVVALATIALIAFEIVAENDSVTITTTWDQAFGPVMFLIMLPVLLPSMVIAVQEPGEHKER